MTRLKCLIERQIFKIKWRKRNKHNSTSADNIFSMQLVNVGKKTYGPLHVRAFGRTSKLKIGNYCSIGPNVAFILCSDHPLNHISTFPFKVECMGEEMESISKGDIIVDDDVWLGFGAIILSGVHIGQGAVVAAGAVVTKDVPPYAIVGGNPARIIKYRFSSELILNLLKIDFSSLSDDLIKANIEKLYQDVDKTIDLSWMPQKTYKK